MFRVLMDFYSTTVEIEHKRIYEKYSGVTYLLVNVSTFES